ncbi:MAG TPA: acVLRF1 family peptidyl-tRNA hydrolase [Nocardioidaceae bacterium]|nr:acVLRF1 family peptidyl-tRNA hydrolase [Nocardioidaceae bacterium]
MSTSRTVLVPAERLVRWFENFGTRHGGPELAVHGGRLVAKAPDGAVAEAILPFAQGYDGPADVPSFCKAAVAPVRWGVLLVRKGGFAVAAGTGSSPVVSKVGQRHVQGRTKAGGQSQQRFARRRDNQARQAYEAAADHAHRVLVTEFGGVEALVCGGDRTAVDSVLSDPRLAGQGARRTGLWLAVPDPRRSVLDRAILDAWSVPVVVSDPD